MEAMSPVSTKEFLEGMFDSDEEKKALADFVKRRRIVSKLAAIRVAKGVKQADIADKLGCGQSAVSKLEAGVDADLTLAHLEAYAGTVPRV